MAAGRNKLLNIVVTEPSCEDREKIPSEAGQIEHVWITSRPPASILYEGGRPLVSARKVQMIRGILDCWRGAEQQQQQMSAQCSSQIPRIEPQKKFASKKCSFVKRGAYPEEYCTRKTCPNLK